MKSNLGDYQTITKVAKLVGGVKNLVVIIGIGGYAMIRAVEGIVKKGFTWNKKQEKRKISNPFDLEGSEKNCKNCAYTEGDANCVVDGMPQCYHGIMLKIQTEGLER